MLSEDTKLYDYINTILSIKLTDILDIIIVSILIYFAIKFAVGTRAWQIITGLSILLIIWIIAKVLELSTLEWIFDNILSIGMFLLIVIFQPELRRGLAKLGEKGIFAGIAIPQKKIIDDILRACSFMAERKIGALIVFERNVDLTHYIEGQVIIDAQPSLELIITIFTPQTPLHDGAVIIRNKRIAYARAFLPLTINPEIAEDVGTRHRAAVGITEETDAVAIIVSEERGEISIAVDGKLYKNLDILTVRKKLNKLLGIEKPPKFTILREKLKKEKDEIKEKINTD